jgi:hypothetical protein
VIRNPTRGLASLAILWAWLVACPVAAQGPVVVLSLDGVWPSELGAEVRADLRASLRERGLSLVDADERPDVVLATIHIDAPDLDRPVARIEIDDRVNQKRVEREIALGREPPDTWSVILAAAADELLRAAWIELTMPDAPPPAMVPPPEVERAARASVGPSGPHDGPFGVAIAGSVEGYTGGSVFVGADASATLYVGELLGIDLGVVIRGLVPTASDLGSLDAIAAGGELGARVALLGRSGLARLDLCAQLRGMVVDFRPGPRGGALANPGQDGVLVLRGGVRLALAMEGAVHVGLSVLVGAPLVGAIAVDSNGTRLAGIDGLELGTRLEVSLWP